MNLCWLYERNPVGPGKAVVARVGEQFATAGLAVDCRPWSEESEVREIQDFGIGIMPLFNSLLLPPASFSL